MDSQQEYTILKRRNINHQQIYEKMLDITGHQRNANQNYNENPPYSSQNDLKKNY